MCRFALHRQGQNSTSARAAHAHGLPRLLLVLPNSAGLGYRPTDLNVSPCTDRRTGFLPGRGDRVFTLGGIR
jgi:hypothetical protein